MKPRSNKVPAERKQKISEGLKKFHATKKKRIAEKYQQPLGLYAPQVGATGPQGRIYPPGHNFERTPAEIAIEILCGQLPKERTIFSEAESIIYGDREKTYGKPSTNFKNTARLWQAFLSAKGILFPKDLTPEDIALMMVLFKIARQIHMHQRDNLVDMCGYTGCVEKINAELSREASREQEVEERRR